MFIVVVLCLSSTPEVCETHYVSFSGNELNCLHQAQVEAVNLWREGLVIQHMGCER